MNNSIDPRVNRINFPDDITEKKELDQWITWEVFHQRKRGEQHEHVGIVHAPNSEMALVMAKETFGRRGHTANIWVVQSSHVYSTGYEDDDIFTTTPEKIYREAGGYKVMDKINKYKKEQK